MWSSGATLLALLLVSVRPALGDACVLTAGSLYQLKSDAVDWTMRTDSGQSCIRGLRHNRATIDTAKLISPPQSGQAKLLGSGFSYTAKSDFEGQDSFTIQVSGMLNGIRGSSDIRIIVSVGPNVSPQTSPTKFVRPTLGDACVLTGGSLYQLKSDAVDWTMRTDSGQSCIRGLRHNRVTIDTAKLISPPQSGQVKLLGSGFSYTAKSDFEGQDSFTIQVSGMSNGIRGSSDIRIIVSVGPNASPQTSPTEFVRPTLGDACVLTGGSLYQLKSDAVDWTMRTDSGQSCIRGLRHNRVTIDTAKLISPPQSGQVKLLGSGFSYTAKSDFEGQDSFTIQVSGMSNGIRGSSDIRIIVSVGPNVSPQTSPTERRDRPPGDLSSAAQPNQNPTAQGTDQTRQVRLADADASMSPSTRPARILPSQQGTGSLQQGTGTNQTIGVPQVRPALVLPQGTVQNAVPLPLQLGTDTNQTIGVGQVRPANAGTSMRPQGLIGRG